MVPEFNTREGGLTYGFTGTDGTSFVIGSIAKLFSIFDFVNSTTGSTVLTEIARASGARTLESGALMVMEILLAFILG